MARDDSKRPQQILCAAEKLFQHYGIGKTTVADIAREAGVGVGTVYLEFTSKEAIVEALSAQRYQSVLAAMRKAAFKDGTCAERLESLFAARIRRFARFIKQGQHGADLVRCACPATEKAQRQFQSEEEDLVTEFLTRAAEAGEFDVTEPRRVARVLIRLYNSYSPMVLVRIGTKQAREEIAAVHRIVLHGLIPRAL